MLSPRRAVWFERRTGRPQEGQNLASSSICFPQFGQYMGWDSFWGLISLFIFHGRFGELRLQQLLRSAYGIDRHVEHPAGFAQCYLSSFTVRNYIIGGGIEHRPAPTLEEKLS